MNPGDTRDGAEEEEVGGEERGGTAALAVVYDAHSRPGDEDALDGRSQSRPRP